MLVTADGAEKSLEFSPAETKRVHVRPDDVLAQVFIHLDDHRPCHTWFGHDEVISLDARFDATRELTNVAELLPGDPLHALALSSVSA